MVQNMITTILTNIIKQGDSLTIETSSFLVNHLVLNSSNLAASITMQNTVIKLPSFCDLTNNILNCSQQIITQRVILIFLKSLFQANNWKIHHKNTLIPMAVSGHNGKNETYIGMSASIGLAFFDSNSNEIRITESLSPIEILIERDKNTLNYSFEYVNATSIGFLSGAYFLQNSFTIKSSNSSIHIEIKPLNMELGYLLVLKYGYMPIVNSTNADYSSFKLFCPSKILI